MLYLIYLLNLSPPHEISSQGDLDKLAVNSKVSITGRIISQRALYEETSLLKLESGIELVCSSLSCKNYLNETVTAIGVKEAYQNKTQIKVLRIINETD